jgi:hypothetical protein
VIVPSAGIDVISPWGEQGLSYCINAKEKGDKYYSYVAKFDFCKRLYELRSQRKYEIN